jgi:Fic family protein
MLWSANSKAKARFLTGLLAWANIDLSTMKTAIDILTKKYQTLCQSYANLERLNLYLISHHSTAIEGSTLTAIETEIFLEKGLTAKGKPLTHHLMIKNHYEALCFVIAAAKEKRSIDTQLIQQINAYVMSSTGTVHHTPLGTFDASKGDLRLLNVRAGITGDSFMSYDKVPIHLKKLCVDLMNQIKTVEGVQAINELAFWVHYQLVTIHPFVDGNGRTSRLLMNYIQAYHGLPLSIVFEEDRQAYIESLIQTRKTEHIETFLNFMSEQHLKFLNDEIEKLERV